MISFCTSRDALLSEQTDGSSIPYLFESELLVSLKPFN